MCGGWQDRKKLNRAKAKEDGMEKYLKFSAIFIFLFFFSGCANLLPSSKTIVDSPWHNFDSARLEYEKIIPGTTNVDDLKKMKFNPFEIPNIRIMNVTEIISVFLPNPSVKIEQLDPGIQECIESRSSCTAYKIEPGQVSLKRVGNFWADLFTFKRHTIETGWEFRGLITIVDNVVTYKDPAGGKPLLRKEEIKNKPLGPLQEIGNIIVSGAQDLL
ncbi:MAG: hypothetical protein KKB30_02690 [Proteobacteria bacterium]|nr:hypothetical protein [Pseudomonadota bacterium]MBU1716751.1 hypothetical protein [Pseudomonadota bacterium]